MLARISIKFPRQFFIHILTQLSTITRFQNKIALPCHACTYEQIWYKYIGIKPLKNYKYYSLQLKDSAQEKGPRTLLKDHPLYIDN